MHIYLLILLHPETRSVFHSSEQKKQKVSDIKTGLEDAEALVSVLMAIVPFILHILLSTPCRGLTIFCRNPCFRSGKWTWRREVCSPAWRPCFLLSWGNISPISTAWKGKLRRLRPQIRIKVFVRSCWSRGWQIHWWYAHTFLTMIGLRVFIWSTKLGILFNWIPLRCCVKLYDGLRLGQGSKSSLLYLVWCFVCLLMLRVASSETSWLKNLTCSQPASQIHWSSSSFGPASDPFSFYMRYPPQFMSIVAFLCYDYRTAVRSYY